MIFGVNFPVVLALLGLLLCDGGNGDPTLVLNSPMGGAPGFGGFYGMGLGAARSSFLFDRDDIDLLVGHPGLGLAAPPLAPPSTIVMVDGAQHGHPIIDNGGMSAGAPIPGVRYVMPRRRSPRRLSPPFYRRRRFGFYG